jgi:hypothetical protein
MTISGVQHLGLDPFHQHRPGRIHPTPQTLQLFDPHDRITRIFRIDPSHKQLIDRQPSLSQRPSRSRIGHPRTGRRQSHQLIARQPPAQGRQRSTPIARTSPIRLETCDQSHGTSLIKGCDNQADDGVGTAKFF